jgi:chaperone modulatory protein CbpM
MITLDILRARFTALREDDLQRWIGEGHVRDVERVRLILELRDVMQVNEEALPVVLSLLDQLYALRRRLRDLGALDG